ncbi:hypothetical protein [Isobaculum melis]|uniref:Uncharacterized protein n=1 Tax=Isobaculum melis TaxID=142588 RepID=A0A1H9U4Y0_9LACT|nr:hypothetical protein [Isobaculum melis]SES04496.1 hypothetical protein SAMN04488559_12151 [Isobaculum melis]
MCKEQYSSEFIRPILTDIASFKKRPLMFMNKKDLSHLQTFYAGYLMGKKDHFALDLEIDYHWLKWKMLREEQIFSGGNLSSYQIMAFIFGDNEEAFDQYMNALQQSQDTDTEQKHFPIILGSFVSKKEELFLIIRDHYQHILDILQIENGILYIYQGEFMTHLKQYNELGIEIKIDAEKIFATMEILKSLSSAFFELNLKQRIITIAVVHNDIHQSIIDYQYPDKPDGAMKIHKQWLESKKLN